MHDCRLLISNFKFESLAVASHPLQLISENRKGFVISVISAVNVLLKNSQMESIRATASDFEARRLLRKTARHQRQRALGTGPMLVPSLQRYQVCPLSKPGIDL